MNNNHSDMVWYTRGKGENPIARYGDFHPNRLAVTGEKTALLLRIACSVCNAEFLVAVGSDVTIDFGPSAPGQNFAESIRSMLSVVTGAISLFHYGYPPIHKRTIRGDSGYLCKGSAMDAHELRIEQFWQRDDKGVWSRIKDNEIDIEDPKDPDAN